jgi:ribonuclease E
MTESQPNDHWKHLSELLGTKSEEADEQGPAASEPQEIVTELPAADAPPPRHEKATAPATGDWNSLARNLGIEVPEPAEAGPAAEESGEELPSEESAEAESPPLLQGPVDVGEASFDASEGEIDTELEPDDECEAVMQPDLQEEPGTVEVSAGEAPVEDLLDAELDDDSPLDEDPLAVASEPFVEEVESAFDFVDKGAESEAEETDADSEDEDEERERPRRRRRRRGRRRRRDEVDETVMDEEDDDVEATGEPDDDVMVDSPMDADEEAQEDGEQERQPRRRRRRRRRPASPKDAEETSSDETADLEAVGDADQDDSETRAARTEARGKHRKIPSWNEAVDVIVTTNLANRQRSSGGSRGKGRK